ncbi:unnamed protein product [Miscanthus lutarioriparius]|uniref:adenylate dimethylallyltransferase (ADP/ATP-dependent) n=1 Tax=Miscanthus lutarioriparius TaxID=422564 RepID=A0A811QVU0_9POAL|nr:unnamed protein product [Miscanthus lutarioriparius]
MEHGVVAARKPKVVFVLGATATGKSKLAIALAQRFNGEVINADKIQVHDGVPILTNKVTEEEQVGVPHHLLSVRHPDADFTAEEFRREVAGAVARGSNTYIEALVEDDSAAFRAAHDLLFIWVDAERELLEWYAALRVDEMVARGLVSEAREGFGGAGADYTRGVRRAISLPEMHAYLMAELEGTAGEAELAAVLECAVRKIKDNTFRLARTQTEKIQRLSTLDGWDVHRIDVTPVFARKADGTECHKETWKKLVWEPCEEMVRTFLEPPLAVVPGVAVTEAKF